MKFNYLFHQAGISHSTWLAIRVLDENDLFPEWEEFSYEGEVLETAEIGSPVLLSLFNGHPNPLCVKAIDMDSGVNGQVTYSFVTSDAVPFFSVDEYTGENS